MVSLAMLACKSPSGTRSELPGGLEVVFAVPITATSGTTQVSATDGTRLFIGTHPDLHAHDLGTGLRLWTYGNAGRPSRIAYSAGRVFSAYNEEAYAVNAVTGAEIWRVNVGAPMNASQGISNDHTFYIGTRNHQVFALEATSGSVRWSRDLGPDWEFDSWVRGLTLSGDTLYASVVRELNSQGGRSTVEIFALDAATGVTFWQYTHGDGLRETLSSSSPRVAGSLLLLNIATENTVVAVNRFTAGEAWKSITPGNWLGPVEPPEIDGTLGYTGSHAFFFEAIRLIDGSQVWRTDLPDGAAGVRYMAVCGSRILTQDLTIGVLARSSGRFLGRALSDDNVMGDPLVVGNTAYIISREKLYAIRCPT